MKRREKEGVRCASAGLAVFFAILKDVVDGQLSQLPQLPPRLLSPLPATSLHSAHHEGQSLLGKIVAGRLALLPSPLAIWLLLPHLRPPPANPPPLLLPTQIWSMKKDSEAAAKKKPKVNAAQLRVQKGTILPLSPSVPHPFRRVGPSPLSRALIPSLP